SYSTITTSFLYVVVLVHIAHLVGGLISLLIVIYNHYKQKYNSSQTLGIELSVMFWHFLGFLWIYLFYFLLFTNKLFYFSLIEKRCKFGNFLTLKLFYGSDSYYSS